MYVFQVLMSDDTLVEIYADYAESAERMAESETGKSALWAEIK